jgi:DNA (cytosine-5)-methyltransferase 1
VQVLDLFSGIGGFSLGLERAGPFRTVAFCERDEFCQAVLKKHWPEVPIYEDVRTILADAKRIPRYERNTGSMAGKKREKAKRKSKPGRTATKFRDGSADGRGIGPANGLGRVDLIVGGFPCQPWSVAGQRAGAEDDRDLWPAMAALVEELRPAWLIGENVRGFINQPMGLQRSLSDLESLGYQAVPFVIPACAVDAPHRRDRVWIVAHAEGDRREQGKQNSGGSREGIGAGEEYRSGNGGEALAHANDTGPQRNIRTGAGTKGKVSEGREQFQPRSGTMCGREDVADTNGERPQRVGTKPHPQRRQKSPRRPTGLCDRTASAEWWATEPDVGRVAHGVPNRVDRLKALGNAVVPQVVERIGRAILAAEEGE